MSIHHEITKKIRGLETKLIFFDKNFEKEFNPKYIKLVKNSRIIEKDNYTKQWFIKDIKGNDCLKCVLVFLYFLKKKEI